MASGFEEVTAEDVASDVKGLKFFGKEDNLLPFTYLTESGKTSAKQLFGYKRTVKQVSNICVIHYNDNSIFILFFQFFNIFFVHFIQLRLLLFPPL